MVEINEFENSMFNFEAVRNLRKSVGADKPRYYLIGLGIYSGSREAREKEGSFFTGNRSITSKIIEAFYIAKKMTSIVRRLEGNGSETLIKRMEWDLKNMDVDKIPESELSRVLGYLSDEEDAFQLVGGRAEIKLSNLGRTDYQRYRRNPGVRRLNELLLKEEEAIRHGLVYELKR